MISDDILIFFYSEREGFEVLFIREEIKKVVWDCDSNKVLGYDGFNMVFVKNMWEYIGDDFEKLIMNFFEIGEFLRKINVIWVIFILKKGVMEIKDFCFISMVGCVYKVIVKVFVVRIKIVMLLIIGEC